MSARSLLLLALGGAVVALAAFLALSSKGDGAEGAGQPADLTVQRVVPGSGGASTESVEADLAGPTGADQGRARVTPTAEETRTIASTGADSNVDPNAARVVRFEIRAPMGAPLDPELRLVGWSEPEVDREDFDWGSDETRRRMRRRGSGSEAVRTFAEAESDDEVRWSVASASTSGPIELAFDADARTGRVQLDGRYLYLSEPMEFELVDSSGTIVIEPEIGAWVTGTVRTGGAEVTPDEDGSFGTVSMSGGTMGRGRGRGMGFTDRRAELDESLGFEFRGVRPDITATLTADVPSMAVGRSDALDLQPGVRTSQDVTLDVGGAIEGRVFDGAGQPVAGATLRAAGQRRGWGQRGGERDATSDADGAFRLVGLEEGSYRVEASLEDWRGGRSDERVEVVNASTRTGVVVRMTRGLTIAGRVTLPDGRPAAGADVRLEQPRPGGGDDGGQRRRGPWGGGNRGPERKSVEAGPDGTFFFAALAETNARIAAALDVDGAPFAAALEDVTPRGPGEGEPVAIALAETLFIAGAVRDDSGAPVTEFEVRAAREGYRSNAGAGDGVRESFEAEDGAFRLGGASEGTWRVSIRAEGYDSPQDQTLTIVLPQEGAPLAFTLTRQGGIRGLVLDPGGAPVPGARVARAGGGRGGPGGMGGGWGRDRGVETDENGAFELENLTPGVQRYEASCEDWASSEPVSIEVTAGVVAEGIVMTLRRGGRITGVVNDESGAPWPGRRVTYASGGGPMAMFGGSESTTTDASGSFAFDRVPPGKWTVTASPDEREMFSTFQNARDESAFFTLMAQNLSQEVTVEDGGEATVQLGAEPRDPVVVFGTIERSGSAVGEGNVTFTREGGDLFANLKRGDIAEGAYRLELDRPGPYIVQVERGSRRNQFLVDVASGGEQRIDLSIPEGGIAGRVVDADGEPAVGVRVAAEASSAYSFSRFDARGVSTDAEGRYEILDLDPGTYLLRVGARQGGWGRGRGGGGANDAYGRATVDGVTVNADAVTANVDVRLAGAGRVIGTITDADGDPVTGATVFVRDEGGRPIDSISSVRTNAAGRFTYDRVAPGTYVVSARTDSAAAEDVGGVVVRESEDTEVELRVDAASTLVVTTVEDDGTPVRVELSVTDSEGREVTGMVGTELFRSFGAGISTSEQRFGPLAPGRYTIRATARDGRSEKKRITVKGTRDTRVRLKFDPVEGG